MRMKTASLSKNSMFRLRKTARLLRKNRNFFAHLTAVHFSDASASLRVIYSKGLCALRHFMELGFAAFSAVVNMCLGTACHCSVVVCQHGHTGWPVFSNTKPACSGMAGNVDTSRVNAGYQVHCSSRVAMDRVCNVGASVAGWLADASGLDGLGCRLCASCAGRGGIARADCHGTSQGSKCISALARKRQGKQRKQGLLFFGIASMD